jgi:phthalate 4,5-dioxygenase oxygenase subunit
VLRAEEIDLLTRVGPDAPLGKMMRRYWVPALLSEELLEPDGAPKPLRLLGEDLVAFRDSTGYVGLLEERCPHRLASLAYGRNEEGGLRCLYHGWKFDVSGRVLDLPRRRRADFATALARLSEWTEMAWQAATKASNARTAHPTQT